MSIKLGVVMDPIAKINYKKDSTLAMLWEAAKRGWEIFYFEQSDLFLQNGSAFGNAKALSVFQDPACWYKFGESKRMPLAALDVIFMRKDPPFNQEYIYTTYMLEHAERDGVLVVNKPQSLRDANEKMYTMMFSECCPPTLITRNKVLLNEFYQAQKDIVCKPLDAMGGYSIFRLQSGDPNASVVFDVLTKSETESIVVQKYIPEIVNGDKRILLVNGEPIPFALARVPGKGEWRGNLAAGAKGEARPLTKRDLEICKTVGPRLREKGLYFVGLDVIGDYLTEINVTSPTCIRELDEQCDLNISATFLNCIEEYYDAHD